MRSLRSTFRKYLSHCCPLTSILCISSRHRRAIESFPILLFFATFIPVRCPVSLITLQPCARRKALVAGKASCSSSICNALGTHYHPMLSFLRRRMHCFTRVSPTNERGCSGPPRARPKANRPPARFVPWKRARTAGPTPSGLSQFPHSVIKSMPAEAKACRLDVVCKSKIRVDPSDLSESHPFVGQLDLFDFGLRAVADPIYEEEWGLMGLQSILSR